MNPLAMTAAITLPEPKALKDIDKFLDRLVAKMEGRLHAKEDTFTLAYYLTRTHRTLLAHAEREQSVGGPDEFTHDITYEGASALAYELKTYPARPRSGVLIQLLSELDRGLREKKQHDRERKRTAKRRDRPTVREARRLHPPGADDAGE
ncbi:MAG: hypothetical protein V3S55_10075 [Nitrospiraceae bacterium]